MYTLYSLEHAVAYVAKKTPVYFPKNVTGTKEFSVTCSYCGKELLLKATGPEARKKARLTALVISLAVCLVSIFLYTRTPQGGVQGFLFCVLSISGIVVLGSLFFLLKFFFSDNNGYIQANFEADGIHRLTGMEVPDNVLAIR